MQRSPSPQRLDKGLEQRPLLGGRSITIICAALSPSRKPQDMGQQYGEQPRADGEAIA